MFGCIDKACEVGHQQTELGQQSECSDSLADVFASILRDQSFDLALEKCEVAIQEFTSAGWSNAQPMLLKGLALASAGEIEGALEHFSSLQIRPEFDPVARAWSVLYPLILRAGNGEAVEDRVVDRVVFLFQGNGLDLLSKAELPAIDGRLAVAGTAASLERLTLQRGILVFQSREWMHSQRDFAHILFDGVYNLFVAQAAAMQALCVHVNLRARGRERRDELLAEAKSFLINGVGKESLDKPTTRVVKLSPSNLKKGGDSDLDNEERDDGDVESPLLNAFVVRRAREKHWAQLSWTDLKRVQMVIGKAEALRAFNDLSSSGEEVDQLSNDLANALFEDLSAHSLTESPRKLSDEEIIKLATVIHFLENEGSHLWITLESESVRCEFVKSHRKERSSYRMRIRQKPSKPGSSAVQLHSGRVLPPGLHLN